MADRSVFEKLAENLPEKERKDLLDKIQRSMSFAEIGEENIYETQMSVDERELLIQRDLNHLSLFSRILLWFRSSISGKSKKDLLVAMKLRSLKAQINHQCPGLTGFETRDITAKFANAVFEIYKLTLPLRAVYRRLLLHSREVEGAFVQLVEKRYPHTKVSLSKIVSDETLEEVYDEKGNEASVRRVVIDHLDEFVEQLDDRIFGGVADSIMPVFYLKDIIFFPFSVLFELFHFSVASMLPEQEPAFKSASAMLAIEHLERLYLALYTVSKIPTPFRVDDDVLWYLYGLVTEPTDREEAPEADEQAPELVHGELPEPFEAGSEAEEPETARQSAEAEDETRGLMRDLTALYEGVRKFDREMPIAELIRYFLKDPYHRMYVYVPQVQMRDYYSAVVKVRLLAELEARAPSLRVKAVERKVDRLFKGQRLVEFLNYRQYTSIDYEKMALPFFSRTWSLNLLYNFIRWYYHEYVQEVVKILTTVILVQNRVTRNKLLQVATAVEDLEQKIREFDESLSPASEEGKLFHRLRSTLAGDPGHQRMFRTIVLQKDAQVNTLIDRGRDSLAGLEKVFEEVATTPSEAVRERLSSRFYLNGKLQPLSKLLKDRAGYLKEFVFVLLQVLKLEGA